MRDISAKQRILKIKDIFEKKTDEFNSLSIYDLIERLKKEYDAKCGGNYEIDKKSINDDLKELRAYGFSLCKERGEHNINLYYYHERPFEIYELRLLIDAVCSARFITKKDTLEIINKLKKLTSENLGKKLQSHLHIDELVKSDNERLKFYLDSIYNAISDNKKLTFQYGNYNIKKEFHLHHNGEFYSVEPYGLVWNSDYYYLVCKDERKDQIINYRVDRMRNVDIKNDRFNKPDFDTEDFIKKCFFMYPGEEDIVEIQFVNKLINVVIDRFGNDITIWNADNKFFTIRIKAAVNEGLLRWVLTWGADAKIIYPEKLVAMIKNESEKMYNLYK